MNDNADESFRGAMMPTAAAPDDPRYQKTYDWPVSASWNQNLLDGTLPAAIARYNTGWMAQLGTVNTEAGWQDYQNYYLNCIQDSDDQWMNVLAIIYSCSSCFDAAFSLLCRSGNPITIRKPACGQSREFRVAERPTNVV